MILKKKLISLLALSLFLSGCNNNWNNSSFENGSSISVSSIGHSSNSSSSEELSESSLNNSSIDDSSNSSSSEELEEYSKDINDYYEGYYTSIRSWDNGQDLFNQLHDLISTDIIYQTYNANWEINKKADQDQYNFDMVDQIYSSSPILKNSTYYGGTGWQKEHAFCQSLMGHYVGDKNPKVVFSDTYALKNVAVSEGQFALTFMDNRLMLIDNLTTSLMTLKISNNHLIGGSSDYGIIDESLLTLNIDEGVLYYGTEKLGAPLHVVVSYSEEDYSMVSDFHNIFASHYSGNASRGNKNLGEASEDNYIDEYHSTTKIFEPGIKDKGIVARAILYMVTCYDELSLEDNYVSIEDIMINGTGSHGMKDDIISWASSLKVDYQEYQHNLVVYKAQANRNPYIDFPEFIDYVFGDKKDEAGTIEDVLDTSPQNLLKTDRKSFKNIAVEGVKYKYEVGEKISISDIDNIYKMYTDLSCEELVDLSGYTLDIEGEEFTQEDIGNKTILLLEEQTGNVCLSYEIEVNSTDPSSVAENKYSFLDDDGSAKSLLFKDISPTNPLTIDHNGIDFIYSIASSKREIGRAHV